MASGKLLSNLNPDLNDLRYTERNVTLNYYELKDEYVSPILSGTNASTMGIFATDGGYETVIRSLAERDNLNSQKIIPLKLGKFVDHYRLSDLVNFDMLYLYDWDYKKEGRAFKLLTDYLYSGKKVIVETGVEVKKSSGSLPEIFPVKKVERKGLGMEWELENPNGILGNGVNFSNFSPPIFDETEWKMSYANEADVASGAQVILKNHGKVVMASGKVGNGEIIWSGLNFAYHLSRNHNEDEAKFFVNFLSELVDLSSKPLPESKVEFFSPNKTTVATVGAKGVLFKEMAYSGWKAKVKDDSQKSYSGKIYKAGPAYPGYIYIPVASGRNQVTLTFSGSLQDKILVYVAMIIAIFVFDEAVFGGMFLGRMRKFAFKFFAKRVGKWWEKEDE